MRSHRSILLMVALLIGAQKVDLRALLIDKVVKLSQLKLQPKVIAETLRCTLGSPHQVTEVRTEYDLPKSDLMAEGSIMTAKKWVAVNFKPSPSLRLALQDLEPQLLDFPYRMTVQSAMFREGPRIRVLQHCFRVPAGMLVVEVLPNPGRGRDLVQSITVTNEPFVDFRQAPTLRSFRR